jgi:peroxidase
MVAKLAVPALLVLLGSVACQADYGYPGSGSGSGSGFHIPVQIPFPFPPRTPTPAPSPSAGGLAVGFYDRTAPTPRTS